MKKYSFAYYIIIFLWISATAYMVALQYNFMQTFAEPVQWKRLAVLFLLSVNTITMSIILLTTLRDTVFQVCYLVLRKKIIATHQKILATPLLHNPKVALLYCTCNDLDERALAISLKQDYKNFELIILDDSSKPEYKNRVDLFAKTHNLRVVRRENRNGFKAGNLNNFLKKYGDNYEFFAVLDSDERLCPDFITNTLKYFYHSPKISAVQAVHTATNGNNPFQSLMGLSVKTEQYVTCTASCYFGRQGVLGHGMMLKTEYIKQVGYFPEMVIEDFALSLLLQANGFDIVISPLIECQEEYPSNYIIAKKRLLRTQEGGVEVSKKMSPYFHDSNILPHIRFDFWVWKFQVFKIPYFTTLMLLCPLFWDFLG